MEKLDHAALQLLARAACANARIAMMAGSNAAVVAAYLCMSEAEREAERRHIGSMRDGLFDGADFEGVLGDYGADLLEVQEALGDVNAFLPDHFLAAIAGATKAN